MVGRGWVGASAPPSFSEGELALPHLFEGDWEVAMGYPPMWIFIGSGWSSGDQQQRTPQLDYWGATCILRLKQDTLHFGAYTGLQIRYWQKGAVKPHATPHNSPAG